MKLEVKSDADLPVDAQPWTKGKKEHKKAGGKWGIEKERGRGGKKVYKKLTELCNEYV